MTTVKYLIWGILTLCLTGTSFAQMGGGAIEGTVSDASGAVIPGATVIAKNVGTNTTISTVTTNAGYFVISPLNAGNYTVTVRAQGFESLNQLNVVVNSLETRSLNLGMQIGQASQDVTVSTAPPVLDTEDSTLGSTMDQETYSALPILMNGNQRQATQFAFLTPGVQSNLTGGNNTTFDSGIFAGGGSRGQTAEIYVDGIALSYAANQGDPRTVWTSIPFDAIQQFQVQTSAYSADLQGQGIENYVIKGGTNQIHGTVFEFWRNTALDTWNFFSKAAIDPATGHATKPIENQNEYGVTIGGPVLKNRVFLFGAYSGYRLSQTPNPGYATIPTLAQRAGDFSAPGNQPIYDPTTTTCTATTCTRTQFMGLLNGVPTPNVIPSTMLSPISQNVIAMLPAPTTGGFTNNYLGGTSTSLVNWTNADRIDATLTEKQRLTVMYAMGRQATPKPSFAVLPLPYNSAFEYAPKTKTIAIEHTYVLGANKVNQLKYGYARYYAPAFDPQYGVTADEAQTYGITGLPVGEASQSFPKFSFSGTNAPSSWGTTGHYVTTYNTYTLVDNFQWTHGKHSITVGGQFQWLQSNYLHSGGGSSPSSIAYAQAQTGQFGSGSTTVTSTSGAPFASFMVGGVNNAGITQYAHNITGLRYRPFSPYVQDNYKVTRKLTLNLGLRYDYFPPLQEANNAMSFFNPTLKNPITGNPGLLEFAGYGSNSCLCKTPVQSYKWNFGPRLGAAYALGDKTVIHGAWGIMYSHGGGVGGSLNGPSLTGYAANPTFVSPNSGFPAFYLNNSTAYSNVGLANSSFPAYTPAPFFDSGLGTGYSTAVTAAASGMTYLDPILGGRAPQFENWNFGIQRSITHTLTGSVSYVGSEGHFETTQNSNARGFYSDELNPAYLALGTNLTNQATPANIAAARAIIPGLNIPYSTFSGTIAQMLLPFPQYPGVTDLFGNVANSNFHALELTVQQKDWKGLTLNINYTYSKNIDNGGTFRSGWLNPRVERSIGAASQPQNFNANFVYHLPFGTGMLSGGSRVVSQLIRNWNVSGIVIYSTGSPLAVIATNCITPGQGQCMPNLASGFSGSARINGSWGHGVTASNVSTPFVNTAAFTIPTPYTIGTAPRVAAYNLYSPANKDVDLSIRRYFAIRGSVKALFQADVTNLFNNVVFGGINQTVGNTSFGTVSSQINSSRDWQIVGKVEF